MKPNKSLIHKIEIAMAALLLIAIVLKLSGFAGMSILIIISSGTLAVIYLFSSMRFWLLEPTTPIMNLMIRFGGFSLAVCLTGLLYKLMLWPGDMMLYVGLPGLLISMIMAFKVKPTPEEQPEINRYNIRFRIVFLVGLLLSFVSKKDLFRYYNSDDSEYVHLYEQMIDNPKNIEYKNAFDSYTQNKRKAKKN